MHSCASWPTRWLRERADGRTDRLRLADAAVQGAAAVLEGELPDDRGTDPDGALVPDDLLACAVVARRGVRRPGVVRGIPDPGAGDDVGAAEQLRQHVIVADPVEDHRQPDLRTAAAADAGRLLRGVRAGGDGARACRR